MEEARTRNAAGRGCGRKPDRQRPQQIVSGKPGKEKNKGRIKTCSSHRRRSSSCHRQVDVWSKSVSKTHHGGGLWSSEVARLIASPATNMHQGPADRKLIKGPGSSLGSQSGGWSIVAFSLHVSAERCQIAHVVCCSSSG